uniref:Uncharacterized protein n=1 Tax=Vitis vinifera TaxID=29760 RepID=F6HPD6_VITVI
MKDTDQIQANILITKTSIVEECPCWKQHLIRHSSDVFLFHD